MSIIELVLVYSRRIKDGRTQGKVLNHLTEEQGELATEVRINEGEKLQAHGPDGVIGEAVDVIINAIDMIYLENPEITEAELHHVVLRKCMKWETKAEERKKHAQKTV